MTTHPTPPRTTGAESAKKPRAARLTRTSAAWAAVGTGLALLVLLIVFMLQNSVKVEVEFLAAEGRIPLGLALLIAAVGGGIVVAIAGMARIIQLRSNARRNKKAHDAR